MSKKTVTRQDLIEAIYIQTSIPRDQSAKLLNQTFEEISHFLEKNGRFLYSGFGAFNVRHKYARIGRNPKTGEPVVISERNVVSFKPSQFLKKMVADLSS